MRPHVRLSEFSGTVMENAKYVRENLEISDIEAIQRFLNKADDIVQSLQVVSQKDKSGTGKIISSLVSNIFSFQGQVRNYIYPVC